MLYAHTTKHHRIHCHNDTFQDEKIIYIALTLADGSLGARTFSSVIEQWYLLQRLCVLNPQNKIKKIITNDNNSDFYVNASIRSPSSFSQGDKLRRNIYICAGCV